MMRAAAALICGLTAVSAAAAEPQSRRITVDGETRRYLLAAPETTPAPLLIALHGEGGLVRAFRRMTRLDAAAGRHGWAVAYLQGEDNSWNSDPDGARPPNDRAPRTDDRGFIDAVIATLEDAGAAALGQVAIVGYGRGGAMAYRYACDRSDRILGFAVVAGFVHAGAPCARRVTAQAMLIQGDSDPIHPIAGGVVDAGRVPGGRARAAPMERAFDAWLGDPDCLDQFTDETPLAPPGVTLLSYVGCGVVGHILQGGGHYWPGGDQIAAPAVYGVQPVGFDASKAIAALFASTIR